MNVIQWCNWNSDHNRTLYIDVSASEKCREGCEPTRFVFAVDRSGSAVARWSWNVGAHSAREKQAEVRTRADRIRGETLCYFLSIPTPPSVEAVAAVFFPMELKLYAAGWQRRPLLAVNKGSNRRNPWNHAFYCLISWIHFPEFRKPSLLRSHGFMFAQQILRRLSRSKARASTCYFSDTSASAGVSVNKFRLFGSVGTTEERKWSTK